MCIAIITYVEFFRNIDSMPLGQPASVLPVYYESYNCHTVRSTGDVGGLLKGNIIK